MTAKRWKAWKILVQLGRETPDSRTRHPSDEGYYIDEYSLKAPFAASADRIVRELAAVLKKRGFKLVGSHTAYLEGPGDKRV